MVTSQPTRKVVSELRRAGFESHRSEGSHTIWIHASGVWVVVPDGHRTVSPGVYRQVMRALAQSKEER